MVDSVAGRKKRLRIPAQCSYLALLVLAPLVLGCPGTSASTYEVYNEVLRDYQGRRTPVEVCRHTNLPIFSKKSRQVGEDFPKGAWELSEEAASRLRQVFPDLKESTLDSFRRRNREPIEIEADSIDVSGVSVATGSCRDKDLSGLRGQAVELSGVGLSDDRRQALVYLGIIGSQTGRGWYILLEWKSGGWREMQRVQAWVA